MISQHLATLTKKLKTEIFKSPVPLPDDEDVIQIFIYPGLWVLSPDKKSFQLNNAINNDKVHPMSKLMKLTIIAHTYHIKRHIKRYAKDCTVLSPADSVCLYLLLNDNVLTSLHQLTYLAMLLCRLAKWSIKIAFSFKTSTLQMERY